MAPTASEASAAHEKLIQRNPHGDFDAIQASRPDWDSSQAFHMSKTVAPAWKPGQGGNDGGASLAKSHVEIDPYQAGRAPALNYKLLISAITPRFIGFISTRSGDGAATNLAPFSYTTVVNHDPPLFVVGIAGGVDKAKDTLRNLLDTKECVVNVISEHFVEAANATSINAPYGISEWEISGLHPAKSSTVKPDRVKEAVFSVEGTLVSHHEFESKATPGKKTGVVCIIEGSRFWAREDAINEDRSLLDPDVLRPVSRLGGITYARTMDGMEIPRPDFDTWDKEGKLEGLKKPRTDEQ